MNRPGADGFEEARQRDHSGDEPDREAEHVSGIDYQAWLAAGLAATAASLL